ncbi:pLS20_p028 family conjugation system transmembrane protein [Listeria booriae]|uniref:DUF8208 domain-containing protein n=3 Tax=Listeria booriae TaxID=1552123 RepID=A0A7X1AAJ9_9LIST|nr:hypothetical protein [Listeria booriae]MBC1333458.1 hypothetical protein [Listeria booriae]MBC2373624.1 hypothetical protein [Listeria booriae]MBC2388763.1 hypothetical protein [Listeria booriae]
MSLEDILYYFGPYLVDKDFNSSIGRWFIWLIVKGLVWVADSLGGLANTVLKAGVKSPFFQSESFLQLVDTFKPLLIGMIILAFLYLGFYIMFTPKMDKRKLFGNIVLSMFILTTLMNVINHANTLSGDASATIADQQDSTGKRLVKQNTVDVLSLDATGWKQVPHASDRLDAPELANFPVMKDTVRNNVPEQAIMSIGYPSEIIDPGDAVFKNDISKEVFTSTLIFDSRSAKLLPESMDKHVFLKGLNVKKYRWKIDMPSVIIELGAVIFVLGFLTISIFKVFFDMGVMVLLTLGTAAYDFSNGQKMKRALYELLNLFAWIVIYLLFMQIYISYAEWVTTGLEIPTIGKWAALIAGAFAVYKGNSKVEQILGLTTGHSNAAMDIVMLTQLNRNMQSLNQNLNNLLGGNKGGKSPGGNDPKKNPNTEKDDKKDKKPGDSDNNPNLQNKDDMKNGGGESQNPNPNQNVEAGDSKGQGNSPGDSKDESGSKSDDASAGANPNANTNPNPDASGNDTPDANAKSPENEHGSSNPNVSNQDNDHASEGAGGKASPQENNNNLQSLYSEEPPEGPSSPPPEERNANLHNRQKQTTQKQQQQAATKRNNLQAAGYNPKEQRKMSNSNLNSKHQKSNPKET